MKTALLRPFLRNFSFPLSAFALGLLCGCGSGIGSSGFNPSTPAPVASTNGPQLGYFWNAADRTLRPILGIPGSSIVGQSVVPAGTYVTGLASSASAMAVLQEPDGSLDIMSLPSGQPLHLTAATTPGAQIRFSPTGKSAVVFTPGAASILLVTSLKSTPSVAAATSPSAIQEAAVSDTGTIAIATAGNSIQLLGINGAATSLASVGALGGLTFSTGENLLYADSSANTLTLTRNATTQPSPALVPTASLLKTPTGLGVSTNGQWVLIANSADPSAVRIDLTSQTAPLRIACTCTPALVSTLSGAGTFRVTAPGDGPLWAIDATSTAPRPFFIPGVHQ